MLLIFGEWKDLNLKGLAIMKIQTLLERQNGIGLQGFGSATDKINLSFKLHEIIADRMFFVSSSKFKIFIMTIICIRNGNKLIVMVFLPECVFTDFFICRLNTQQPN